jgi:ankyrin repeat protein
LFEKLLKKADSSTVRKRNYKGANVLHKLYEDASSDDSEKESRKRERLTRKLVQEFGVDINAVDFWRGRSVFMTAVSNGNIADLKSLIKLGADPFGKGHSGRDALMELVEKRHPDMEKLKFLVEEVKLPLTAIDDEGKNVLCFAMDEDK